MSSQHNRTLVFLIRQEDHTMNQNMELDFGYKVIIQIYSHFLALSQQSLEHYHALYMVEYLTYAFSITYSTAAQKRRSSGVR